MSALKPCPFCGESERLRRCDIGEHERPDDEYVRCGQCEAEGPINGYGRDWNTRTDTSADRIVALEEGLRECATRFRRCVIAGGTAEEYADGAVERYTALLTHTEGSM